MKQVTHRDIKLENILIDDEQIVRLIDFGFSTCFSNDIKAKLCCGTPSYMAPEIIQRQEFYGPPVDIWAFGILLYVILCGQYPFKGINDRDLYRKIVRNTPYYPETIPASAKELIKSLLTSDASARLTAAQVLDHPWLNNPVTESSPCFDAAKAVCSPSEVKTQPSSQGSLDLLAINDIVSLGYRFDEVTNWAKDQDSHIGRLYAKLTKERRFFKR